MDSYKFLILVFGSFCVLFEPVLGDTVTPWLAERQLSPSVYVSFPISREAIVTEIERRTAEGNSCDNVVRNLLLEWVDTITDPIVEMFIHINSTSIDDNNEDGRDGLMPMETSMMFFVSWKNYSLGLTFFTTNQDHVEIPFMSYLVDGITVSDDYTLLTVTKADDRLEIALDWSQGDCESAETMHDYTSPKFYHSWYPQKFDEICVYPFCRSPLLDPHVCGIHRTGDDVCYVEKLDGRSCKFSASIAEMTGVFRERSLITDDTSLKSSENYYFEGFEKVAFSYPCINHRQTCN